MDLNKLTLMGMVKGRLDWLTQRQGVLSQNVANSDTPGYKSNDLKPLDFKKVLESQQNHLALRVTSPQHVSGGKSGSSPYRVMENTSPYETSPDGNSVVLEEQMAKIGETQLQYNMTTELYRKQMMLIKIAIGKGR